MTQTEPNKGALALEGARLVLREEVVEGATLYVEGGRIARVGGVAPTGARVIDLAGLTLYPGFIDVHIHGAVGVDTLEAGAAELHRVALFLAREGVTAWLPTLVPAPDEDYRKAVAAVGELMRAQEEEELPAAARVVGVHYEDYRKAVAAVGELMRAQEEEELPAAARVVGVHYEGPFVNERQCGALRTAYFKSFARGEELDELPTLSAEGAAHMITLAPEVEGGVELVEELTRRGWVVSVGHTRASLETLERARAAGARHMTHFLNAMSPLHHREPGPIGWGLLQDDVTVDLIADGVHSDPLMLRLVLRCKTAERVSLISDSVAPAGLGDGEFRIWGETITVEGGRTRNERGSIAGSVISMLDAARNTLALGLSETELARVASLNPARLLRIDDACGSIEEGKRADLTALDGSGQVRLTLVGGRLAHSTG